LTKENKKTRYDMSVEIIYIDLTISL